MATTPVKNKTRKHNFLRKFWLGFSIFLLFIVLIFFMIGKGWLGYVPDIEELQNPKIRLATEIYSSDLEVLGRYYFKENRVGVSYNQISPNLIKALVATEDKRYYSHSGIDGRGLIRAFALLGRKGGGSTITQQLAKQLYSEQSRNIFERALKKPIEWVIAVKLERLYSKEEIATLYLNQVDFLNNAVGIKSAAMSYFNTTPEKLTIEQAATIVGMCKNPSVYNPRKNLQAATNRRNTVLEQMLAAKDITKTECDSLKKIPLTIDFHRFDHKDGLAAYFREYLRKILTAQKPQKSDYAEWQKNQYEKDNFEWENNPLYGFCEKTKKPDGSKYNIYSDGLKIYTTIDSRMQLYAEEAVLEQMTTLQEQFFKEKKGKPKAPYSNATPQETIDNNLNRAMRYCDRYLNMKKDGASDAEIKKAFNTKIEMQVFSYKGSIDTVMTPLDSIRYTKYFLRCGMMSIDPQSGHVKAYVGGTDFSQFQYDMVTHGRRQIGSTVKPFLYSLAMSEKMAPCDEVIHQPITIHLPAGNTWTPRNSTTARRGEMVSLRWGLANSSNWVSAYLMSILPPAQLVDMMHSFGITGYLPAVPSLCLGPCEVSVEEMVDAYTAFPNNGMRVTPIYVTRIEDAKGNIIASFSPEMHEVFDETTAYEMIYMLRGVIDGGTGSRVRRLGLTMPAGGKTGTTNDNADSWFMGFTPTLVTGVWVGGEDRDIHFDTMLYGQGAASALPVWAFYMKKVLANPKLPYNINDQFNVPASFNPNADCSVATSSEGVEE
ncbi:MAG: transglycosylase domain-containing protein [Paludibacter sp.]|nr:transglycosylase domain-containing protein [Paludibacter sp.]